MRFLIIVKACAESETTCPPDAGLTAAMAEFHAALARDGALLDAGELGPGTEGWRIHYGEAGPRVEAGTFGEPGQRITGYTLIQARSHDEALEWARRFPNPHGASRPAQIEVHPVRGPTDPPSASRPEPTPHTRRQL